MLCLWRHTANNATDLLLVVNFTGCYTLPTSCNKLVNFIKSEIVETTCSKPVDNNQGRNLSDNWGGGGVYSYIRVMPDGFLLKPTQIQKKSVGQNMNI